MPRRRSRTAENFRSLDQCGEMRRAVRGSTRSVRAVGWRMGSPLSGDVIVPEGRQRGNVRKAPRKRHYIRFDWIVNQQHVSIQDCPSHLGHGPLSRREHVAEAVVACDVALDLGPTTAYCLLGYRKLREAEPWNRILKVLFGRTMREARDSTNFESSGCAPPP